MDDNKSIKVNQTTATDTGFYIYEDGTPYLGFQIGASQERAGIYDNRLDKWALLLDGTNIQLNGTASTATKLATARPIQTNLASTSAASFDGSSSITPGVTGTLPIANGGTGNTTGKATSADVLNSKGTITLEAASGTTAPSANAVAGMALYKLYKQDNSPCAYGNLLTIYSQGAGQLALEWKGTDNTTGHLYYRSHRDTSTGGYGPWKTVAFTDDTVTAATTATKLATARTIQTNLASTSSASFNGTANITPGVTGILPIANGGTGNSTGSADSLTWGSFSDLI